MTPSEIIKIARHHRQADVPHGRYVGARGSGQSGNVPPDSELLKGTKAENNQPYLIEKRVLVSGEDLTDAQPGFDQRTSEPIVTFRFNNSGAQPLRRGDAGKRRQAVRDRARRTR